MRFAAMIRLLTLVGMFVGLTGCPNRQRGSLTTKVEKVAVDPWATAVKALAKGDDQPLPEFRRILEALNGELASNETAAAPTRITPEREKQLEALFPNFSADDWLEVKSNTFTRLDSTHYVECLFFRDAIRALDVGNLAPAEKAAAIFDWVTRQVYLHQTTFSNQYLPNMPPVSVLKRGWGNPTERAMVALRAFQIAGLDACLLGAPGSETLSSTLIPGTPPMIRHPFWGVGVKVADGIVPFHLASGSFVKRADGQPVRLAELIAKPDLAKAWSLGEALAKSVPVIALPLSTMGQRWSVLEAKLEIPMNVGIDPIALRDAFGPSTKAWNPAQDEFDLARGLARITLKSDGGRETETRSLAMLDKFAQVPTAIFAVPGELQNIAARDFIGNRLATVYAEAFLEPPSPKERIARGAFFEVTKDLVEKENRFGQAATRYETQQTSSGEIRSFLVKLNDLYFALESAQNRKDAVKTAQLQGDIEKLQKENGRMLALLFDGLLGTPCVAESTYLLALNKQEIAERFQLRADRAVKSADEAAKVPMADPKKVEAIRGLADQATKQAADSWAAARDWWDRYERYRDAHGKTFPGRLEHAKALAEIARVKGR
jgi:hypothetical protein